MTKILLLVLVLGLVNQSIAQCETPCPCNNPIDVSSLTKVEYLNSVNNRVGDKCFIGQGTVGANVNWNGWTHLTFMGRQEIRQVININPEQRVCMKGNITVRSITFAGTASKAILRIGDNSVVHIDNIVANNSYNYILISPSAKVFYKNMEFFPEDTIKLSGNETNIVSIKLCNGSSSATARRKK